MVDQNRVARLFRNLPEITTPRLLLRKFKRGDASAVFAYASDPQVALYTLWDRHRDVKTTRKFVEMVVKAYKQGRPAPWAIVLRGEDKLIGAIGLRNWVLEHARAEVGYVVAREYWGNGYASEALQAVLTFAFSHMHVNRIEAKCVPENRGSSRVLEKGGMHCEGLLRDYEFVKGEFQSLNMYSILKREFHAK